MITKSPNLSHISFVVLGKVHLMLLQSLGKTTRKYHVLSLYIPKENRKTP